MAALAVAILVGSSPAHAQPPQIQERQPSNGVDRIYHDYSGEADASSLELNPAMMSTLRGADLTMLGYRTLSGASRGTGFGAFGALNLFGVALGLGVQSVQPERRSAFDPAAAENPDITKISVGLAAGERDHGGVGLAVHGIRGNGRWLRSPDLDIGALLRIFNYGSLGVSARLGPASLRAEAGLPAAATLTAEGAIRPLGTHHLELAGGLVAHLAERNEFDALSRANVGGVLPRARVALRYHGLALLAEAQQVRVAVLDELTGGISTHDKAWRGSVGLEGSWDAITLGTGVHAGLSNNMDGIGFKARFATAGRQGRVFWPRRVDAESIALDAVTDEYSLVRLLTRLERARQAGARAILLIDARGADVGWASLHEVRNALIRIRNAGGHVFAYVEEASMKDYYVASAAERIFIHPAGQLDTFGISTATFYYRDALAKIGVRAEALHIAEYKSAHESYSRSGPSDADRDQRENLLGDIFDQLVVDIARGRELAPNDVRRLVNEAPHGPEAAVKAGLVDEVVFRDELLEKMSDAVEANVSFSNFQDTRPDTTWSENPFVAVVVVEGTLVDGESSFIPLLGLKFAGGDTIAKTLQGLRSTPACKGIIVRINSPGGSALASDIIWREVQRTHDEWKRDARHNPPIVVSMGDVAASGGYYIAMGSEVILADSMTITGSIGVVSIHFDVSGLLSRLGINRETFSQGRNPDIGSPWAPYTEDQRARLEKSMRRTYDLFRKRVARARGIKMERVDKLGRGHVYSGADAADLKLITRLGGLDDAVSQVRKMAEVKRFRDLKLRVVPQQQSLLDLLLDVASNPFREDSKVRARWNRRAEARKTKLPLALDRALARLPMSILFLPQDRASLILPGEIQMK